MASLRIVLNYKMNPKPHTHFCPTCKAVYACQISEPSHHDTAQYCLPHYLEKERNGTVFNPIFKRAKRRLRCSEEGK